MMLYNRNMTDALGDILAKKNMAEPAEIRAAKNFVRDLYQVDCGVTVRATDIVLTVSGAALAGSLRMHIPELQAALGTTKKIIIRIS